VIGMAYDAALEPNGWASLLAHLSQALEAERASIGLAPAKGSRIKLSVAHEHDPALLERWLKEFDGYSPIYQRVRMRPCGEVLRAGELRGSDWRRSEVYQRIFRPMGLEDQVGAFLSEDSGGKVFVELSRSYPFDEAQIKRLQYVLPHLVRAAVIHQKVYVPSCPRGGVDAALDLLSCGLVTVAWNGIVLHANREAERILRESDGFATHSSRLETSDPLARSKLDAAIAQAALAATGGAAWGATALAIRRLSEKRPYEVLVAPIAPRAQALTFCFLATAPAAIVLVTDPDASPAPATIILQRLYNLTPALARLAAALAAGKTVSEYAEAAHVTQGTARQQLKKLFVRTQTRRQAELVGMLLRGVGQFRF
jgi:hypothetical protein